MSTSFDVFPTQKKIPKCDKIIEYSVRLFSEFLKREEIEYDIKISTREITADDEVYLNPAFLVSKDDNCTAFNLNQEGEVYVFFHKLTEFDKAFLTEDLQGNMNAQSLKNKIDANLEVGYCWNVKRTLGQPAIVSLFYGYLAIAIAVMTDGIIYSDDGAWDYSSFPIEGSAFKEEYINIDKINDAEIRENIKMWLDELKCYNGTIIDNQQLPH